MTMKSPSRDKLGRNPFVAKPTPKSAHHILDTLDEITAATHQPSWVERAVSLPVRGLVLGLKSWLVVRYLMGHPETWKI